MTGKCRASSMPQQKNTSPLEAARARGGLHAAVASAARASARMRSTMERNPFERCGVRCSRRPSRSNTAIASAERMSRGPLAGKHRKQDGDKSAHDMGIAVAGEGEHGPASAVRMHGGREPDLARAALHLVRFGTVALGQRAQAAAELDDIAVAVVPLLEQRKVVDDLVERRHVSGEAAVMVSRHTGYIGAMI